MIAPIGGTRMPSSDSQGMNSAQTLAAAITMPTAARPTANIRMRPPPMRDQPTAELYRQCAQTEPRLQNRKMKASTDSQPCCCASR